MLKGKSSFGNTILNDEIFSADTSPIPITKSCQINNRLYKNKQIFVVDTPGFLDQDINDEQMKIELAKSYEMTAFPGPHAFLLVIEPTRFLPQEEKAIEYLDKMFGKEAVHHTIIIFTHGESFRKTTIQQYLDKLSSNSPLRILVKQCNDRYLTVNNYGTIEEKNQAIENLLLQISILTGNNYDNVYTNQDFDEINKAIKEEKSKGTYQPFKSDGIYYLLPQTKKIIIDRRFGANQRRGFKS